jgi:hypothetical protein
MAMAVCCSASTLTYVSSSTVRVGMSANIPEAKNWCVYLRKWTVNSNAHDSMKQTDSGPERHYHKASLTCPHSQQYKPHADALVISGPSHRPRATPSGHSERLRSSSRCSTVQQSTAQYIKEGNACTCNSRDATEAVLAENAPICFITLLQHYSHVSKSINND